ncbi:hypothetical protein C0J50_11301 [Silurus asotus]|uniref:Uncharacterized protein n=1 Tax=Silurus asotus TaxID=30991 RepID=A0AAD5ABK0_SILAS|nr:hypothetical protein C0J50_11301 [Silurus asotus]
MRIEEKGPRSSDESSVWPRTAHGAGRKIKSYKTQSVLKLKFITFQECDREPQDHSILQDNKEMEKVLQEKDKIIKALEFRLTEMVDRERSLEEQLTEAIRELEMKCMEQQASNKELKRLWSKFEDALSFLADAECQEIKALEANAELRHLNSSLIKQRDEVKDLGHQCEKLFCKQSNVRVECMKEQRQSQKDYYTLWIKYEEAASLLVEAKAREKKAMEVNAELKHNNSVLMEQREALKESVKHLRDVFAEHRKMRIRLLKNENNALKKQVRVLQTKLINLKEQLEICRCSGEEQMDGEIKNCSVTVKLRSGADDAAWSRIARAVVVGGAALWSTLLIVDVCELFDVK